MQGTTVYFRDNAKGWCIGRISKTSEGGQVVLCKEEGAPEDVKVNPEDVAVARPDSIGEAPWELSSLSALHPATFVMAIRQRYESGLMATLVGPHVMIYLTPSSHGAMESIVASDSRKADYYNPPTVYPPSHVEPDAQPLQDKVNKNLFEPLGYWSHAKAAFRTAMTTGRGTLVCLGEVGTTSWLHRLAAFKHLKAEHTSAVAALRLGSTTVALPPQESEFHDDLMYTTEFSALQSASERCELALGRMGSGRWMSRDKTPASREYLTLTALLADAHCVLNILLGAGGGRHANKEMNTPTAAPPRAVHCRHTKLSYTSEGILTGFFMKAFWTNRVESSTPLHSFRLLANSKLRTKLLGGRDHPSWYSPVPFVASGEAFDELAKMLTRIGLKKVDVEGFWCVVAAVMLLRLARFEDVQGKAELFCDCIPAIAQLLAVSPQVLQYTLCPPRKLTRIAAEAKRDALCHALYESSVQWVVACINLRSNAQAVVDAPYVVSVINVPGASRPLPGETGTLGDLCHNICSDAMWGLYDMSVFDTALQTAEMERCPQDPLLEQLRGRPVLERLNPLLQTLSHLDINEPVAASESKECSHASGDTIQYDLVSVPAPAINELYGNGVLGTEVGDFVKRILKKCKQTTMAAEAITAMSELLASAKAATLPGYWLLTIDPSHPTPSLSTGVLSFSGVMLENGLYACRVVETALLNKVGYPIQLPMKYFASLCKPIIYPSQIRQLGTMKAVKLVAETVFSTKGMAWERMVDLEQLPETPAPMHIGHTKVLLTSAAMGRIDALRRFTMNKLAVLIQAFARATLPRKIWKINHSATVVQASCRARISASFRTELNGVASLKIIANEIAHCIGRRRTWRAANGVATSPLPFRTLKKLLSSQQADRDLFVETALSGHFEYGFSELEATTLQLMNLRSQLLDSTYAEQRQSVEDDQRALRSFLTNTESTSRSQLHLLALPLWVLQGEEDTRGRIAEEEAVARSNVLLEHYEHQRDHILLSEHVEYICLIRDNNFMLRIAEEAAHRLIVAHTESRCRDLLMKDFTLRALRLDGIGDPSYGSDWKVELEGLRREVILSAERTERGNLYLWFLSHTEGIYRCYFEQQCTRWYAAVLGQGNPLVVQFKQDSQRSSLAHEEATARQELQFMQLRSFEKQGRRRTLRECEGCYTVLRDTHYICCEEAARREHTNHEYCRWVAQVASSKPGVSIAPQEHAMRRVIHTAELFCRCHIKDRLVQEYCELEGRLRIMGYFKTDLAMMNKVRQDFAMLQAERRAVREKIATRRPIVLKAYDPRRLVVRSPLPPPVPAPVPPPSEMLYEQEGEVMVAKGDERCKSCESLEDFRSVSPPRGVTKQTALEEAQALLKSMMQHAEQTRIVSPRPPPVPTPRSPEYDFSRIPDPFTFSPPPPAQAAAYPPTHPPPPSPSLTTAANTLSSSLMHLQKLTGRGNTQPTTPPPPPAPRQVTPQPAPTPRRHEAVTTFSFDDIYKV